MTNVAEVVKPDSKREESIVGKGEKLLSAFSPFPIKFLKASSQDSIKSGIHVGKG